jgi:hypothetical protein
MPIQRRGFMQLLAGLFTAPLIPKAISAQEPEAPKPEAPKPKAKSRKEDPLKDMFSWYADVFAKIECFDERVTTVFIPFQYLDAVVQNYRVDHSSKPIHLWGAQIIFVEDPDVFAFGERGTTVMGKFMQNARDLTRTIHE